MKKFLGWNLRQINQTLFDSLRTKTGAQHLERKAKKGSKERGLAPDMHAILCDLTCCLNLDLLPLPGERS